MTLCKAGLFGVFISVSFSGACGLNKPADNDGKWTTISPASNKKSYNSPENQNLKGASFLENLPKDFSMPLDEAGKLLLEKYGAVFVAQDGSIAPRSVFLKDDREVAAFQSLAGSTKEVIGNSSVELQPPAMAALKSAMKEANANGGSITPRGSDASKRSFQDTVGLWASRVDPGLDHYVGQGRISKEDAVRIRALSPYEQVPEILKLEAAGMYFSKDLSKSIIYSVAPPGSSQHLSMLALDINEHESAQVRSVLAQHGWFQTVVSDLPHFTYIGVSENELPKLGLKKTTSGGRVYWVPNM